MAPVTLAALDLNAERARAVSGKPGQSPRLVELDGEQPDLPLILSAEKRALEVGRAGRALERKSPQWVYKNFLPRLGEASEWRAGHHHLDAAAALSVAFNHLRACLPGVDSMVLAVPGYLAHEQMRKLARLAQEAGLAVAGIVTRLLAAGLASYAEHPWHNAGVVVDVDDHAWSCAVLRPADAEMRLLGQRVLPSLGLRLWKERLMAKIADQCIRMSRRDPRESPDADQGLYEQMGRILDGCSQNRPVPIRVETAHWNQTLVLQPGDAAAACGTLARQVADEIRAALAWVEQQMTSATIYLTAEAARLPGLAAAIYQRCENKTPLVVLAPLVIAQAAWELARRIQRGELSPSFFASSAPLPFAEVEPPSVLPFREQERRVAD